MITRKKPHLHRWGIKQVLREADGHRIERFTCKECGKFVTRTFKPRTFKRSTKPIKRTRLKPQSKKQSERMKRYLKMLKDLRNFKDRCSFCRLRGDNMDPHHPYGRARQNLFLVIRLHRHCHDYIHQNPNEAYRLGWLQPPIRGLAHDPRHPTPWKPEDLITE